MKEYRKQNLKLPFKRCGTLICASLAPLDFRALTEEACPLEQEFFHELGLVHNLQKFKTAGKLWKLQKLLVSSSKYQQNKSFRF